VLILPICYSYSNFKKILRGLCLPVQQAGVEKSLRPLREAFLKMFHARLLDGQAKAAKKMQ